MKGKLNDRGTKVNSSEIARIINEIYHGVESSVTGKIIKDNELGKPETQLIAFNTYLYCLSSYLPKNISADMDFNYEEEKNNDSDSKP